MDEEMYQKQRSRADWLREEDKNIKFFHSKAIAWKRKNKIQGIENAQGQWVDSQKEIEREFCDYFQTLLTSSKPSENRIEEALNGLLPNVTPYMNAQLEEPFTQ